jgi:sugar diacid utilization regulator
MATAGKPASPVLDAGGIPLTPEFAGAGETALLRKLVAMCSHLSTLASQTTELGPLVQVLADGIGAGVAVVDPTLEMLACARVPQPEEIAGQLRDNARRSTLRMVLSAAARNRRALAVPDSGRGRMSVVAPVFVGEDVGGYLLTLGTRPPPGPPGPPGGDGPPGRPASLDFSEDMRLLAIEHAAMVCGLVLGRDLVVAAAAGRARQELVEGLLLHRDRSDPEVERWARHLGLDPTREHCVVAFEVPLNRPGAGPSPVELLVARNAPGAILASRADEVVAIVPVTGHGHAPAEQARALARACLADGGQRPRVTGAGIGTPCSAAADIARSYAEARRALAAGRRMAGAAGPGPDQAAAICAFADLGIHRLFLRVPDVRDLRSFAQEVLGGLAADGRPVDIDYLATLSAYFRENRSPARAAQLLHVHPNTVSYRIRRIEELTGLSFSTHRDRLMAEVAVEILEGLESAP